MPTIFSGHAGRRGRTPTACQTVAASIVQTSNARCSKPADTNLYKVLEVKKNASDAEIKKAYRKLAVQHHPDKGGDPEMFQNISRAYQVLSDSAKRRKYDEYGEDGIEGVGGSFAFDLFNQLFNNGCQTRPKTKDVVEPLKLSLEELYSGVTKKITITREVIDKRKGVKECRQCAGQGVTVEVIRMRRDNQQIQSQCRTCGGTGKKFSMKEQHEMLEVVVQKGSPDGHRIRFRGKADEQPDAETGDFFFVVEEQEHPVFKRRGADLFIERTISTEEATHGAKIEMTHLDGRKLLIKTSPRELLEPTGLGSYVAEETEKIEWEMIENCDCPIIDNVANSQTTDVDALKEACETQLKRNGIDVGAFVVNGSGACFKQCTRKEALAAKKPCKGCTMYIVSDPVAMQSNGMMKAVANEGMPTYKNPFVTGNLFLSFTVDSVSLEASPSPRQPPPVRALDASGRTRATKQKLSENDPNVEVHTVTDIDPAQSYKSNLWNMKAGSEQAFDEDEEEDGGTRGSGGRQDGQCQQQ